MHAVRKLESSFFLRALAVFSALGACALSAAETPRANEVAAALKRSADWQLSNPTGTDITDWVIAPLYDGLLRAAIVTGEARYMEAVARLGQQAGWSPRWRIYHADDHAVGHAWLDIFLLDRSRAERLAPMKDRLDQVLAHPITEALDFRKEPRAAGVSKTDRWTWCDALYMAPPTLARLYTATGDARYLDFLDAEFRYTYDQLFDHDERLFYRDGGFIGQRTPHGKKVFWSRGNGWVYGGLALLLEHLPATRETRGFYEDLFREMTLAVLAAQQPDGLWRPSLLDPEHIPMGETSGSGFYTFGLAWGVNNGLLDRAEHMPAIARAWNGLLTRVRPNGRVGYVQQIGDAPDAFTAESVKDYGSGAFLLAGSELLRALGGAATTPPADLLAEAERTIAADNTPRAHARLVPERKDDLAWENDKVAFRIYGPALREGPEDSGIDAWCKKVDYPVIDKWYRLDLAGKQSYHEDHGEGLDAFKVGDSRGCGGIGLWVEGKLVTPDVYQHASVHWTGRDVAEIRATYQYPLTHDGRPVYEHRVIRLRLGERLCDISARFTSSPGRWPRAATSFPYEVAIGLATQAPDARIILQPEHGVAAIDDEIAGSAFFSGIVIDPARVSRMEQAPHDGEPAGLTHALVFTSVDETASIRYRAGFAWAADGGITNAQAWLDDLRERRAE